MSREEAIKYLKEMKDECNDTFHKVRYVTQEEVLEMAIQALSQEPKYWMDNDGKAHKLVPMVQEPCTDTVSIRKDILKCRVGELVVYNVEWLKKHWQMEMDIVCGVKPCEDAISREMALEKMADYVASGYADSAEDFEEYSRIICQLPSVTQKSGKWIKVKSGDKDFPESIVCSRCSNENSHLDFNENAEPIGKVFVTSKYCPNCGAKMESEVNNG